MSEERPGTYIAGGCGCLSLIAVIVVLSISFHQLDQLDYGIDYNMISARLEGEVYTKPGLYSLGPGHKFITYPRTIQTITFSAAEQDRLQTRTSDGLPVKLGISFQWRYDPARLIDLYLKYEKREMEVYENTAKATLANAATNYTAYTFFNDKPGIAATMQIALAQVFDEQLYATIDAFQITQVELPEEFQQAILASIAAKQNITATERYKDNMLVTFAQQILVANQSKLQTIATAQGLVDRRHEQADATVAVTRQIVEAEMYSYGNLSQTVGLDEDGGLSYIWWDAQTESVNSGKTYLAGLSPDTYIRQS